MILAVLERKPDSLWRFVTVKYCASSRDIERSLKFRDAPPTQNSHPLPATLLMLHDDFPVIENLSASDEEVKAMCFPLNHLPNKQFLEHFNA